jgi:class 3 adenylate cyclase
VRPEVRRTRFHDPDQLPLRDRIIECESGVGVVMANGERLHDFLSRSLSLVDIIEPGGMRSGEVALEPGYLLVCPQAIIRVEDAESSDQRVELSIGDEGRLRDPPQSVSRGTALVTMRNDSSDPRRAWTICSPDGLRFRPPQGYTAARLIHHPHYRELFPSNLACAGRLTIRDVTILFSDVVGSTAMYRELGDLKAYERVREHFAAAAAVLARHNGLWIKDIGDAIMASFPDPESGARAALEMHEVMREIGLGVKVGLHSGTCIGVTYHEQFDWFGSTVNLAARIQSLAGPGELCISEEAYQRAAAVLSERPAEPFEARVRGIDEPIAARRLPVSPPAP